MRKTLLALCIALTATLTANAQNLLQNAGMEAWENGLPTAWDEVAGKATNVTVKEAPEGRSGKAVEIPERSYNGKLSNARFTQALELKAGTYLFSFWAKGAAENKKAYPAWVIAGEDGKPNSKEYKYGKGVALSTTEWTEVTQEFTLAADAKIWLVLRNDKGTSGSIYVDDASLTLKSTSSVASLSLDAEEVPAFDLSGRRVSPQQKGIVIVGGVKRINP